MNFVWCKLCAKHKSIILTNPLCKGNSKKAAEIYVNGTKSITKFNIMRHLSSECHHWVENAENASPKKQQTISIPNTGSANESSKSSKRLPQPRIDLTIANS